MIAGLLFAAMFVGAVRTADAQPAPERYAGRTVSAVQVLVDGEAGAEPSASGLVETRVGEPLSLADVRESIAQLYSLGQYQDIRVEAVDAPGGGIVLRYDLVPIRAVQRIEFRGQPGISERTLRNALTERFGRAPQLARVAEMVRALERLYEDRGFFRASVRPVPVELDASPVLAFDIAAGPRARIETVTVTGEPLLPQPALLDRLEVAPGDPYERIELEARLARYAARLRSRGHLQATVSHSARLSTARDAVDLTLDVRPGPLVAVRFEGDQLPADRRAELAPLVREGSIDEDLLEDSVQRIRAYLREQGHWRADVAVEPREVGDGRLEIVFTIRRGPAYRVAPGGVEVVGNDSVPLAELAPLIPLAPGDLYVASRLEAAAAAVLRLYRVRGFAWVSVRSSEEEAEETGVALVRPTITIAEGPRALVGDVAITGANALSEAEVRRLLQLGPGDPFYEPTAAAGRDAVQLEYLNLGFASATVRLVPAVSEDRTRVDLVLEIVEGPQTIVDRVIVVGNQRTAESVIRREILLRPGEPLGLRDLIESRRRLGALGLFRRIDIRELEHGPPTGRDVLVTVEEAPATTVGFGGGLELNRRLRAGGQGGTAEERLELAPRGFFDIGRRNLGGKNRSVNLFTRVSVRPRDSDDPDLDGEGLGLSEYRLVGTYRAPTALLWNSDFSLTGALEQGVRTSFNFTRKGLTAEFARRLAPTLRGSLRYSFGTTRTFDERLSEDEQAAIDRLFPQVRLSTVSGALVRDTRDDVVEPGSGTFLSAEGSIAARALGGQVGFVKTYVQGYWFRRVAGWPNVVFATRASVGMADGFPRPPQSDDPDARPIEDLPASERFFAGGDTTIRGFALDAVGAAGTITERGFPTGGNAVLILNGELRVPVWRDLGAAFFVDGGNVFRRVSDLALDELRGSVGVGVRYRSPIGPVRLDVGFKMDRREIRGRLEPRRVLHFSIGQAF